MPFAAGIPDHLPPLSPVRSDLPDGLGPARHLLDRFRAVWSIYGYPSTRDAMRHHLREGGLTHTRILLVAMPSMLREIVEGILASEPDMIVVRDVRRAETIAAAAKRLRADVVILGESHASSGEEPWRALNEDPHLRVLSIAEDGRRATRYELRPHRSVIEEVSSMSLIEAIRVALTREATNE